MPPDLSITARHLGGMSPPPRSSKKPRVQGALRGLDLDDLKTQPVVEDSMERESAAQDASDVIPCRRHATRSTNNGPANVNYSQKYHPMDEVTRPKRARRITGSRNFHAFMDTSDEEESAPKLSSGEGTDAEDHDEDPDVPAIRKPDPRAIRHSTRTEANKPVNYSRAHHPQDSSIPGFQHLARRQKRRAPANKLQKRKRESSPTDTITLSSDKVVGSDSDADEGDDQNANKDGDEDRGGNEPLTVHSSPESASPPANLAHDLRERAAGSKGSDMASRPNNLIPALRGGGSSFNAADAIIQGKYIRGKESFNGQPKAEDIIVDDPTTGFAEESTKDIGLKALTILEGVRTPEPTNMVSATRVRTSYDGPDMLPPPATMLVPLVTPVSIGTPGTSDRSCTQSGLQLNIKRPDMAARRDDERQIQLPSPSLLASVQASSKGAISRSTKGNEDINISKEEQHPLFDNRSRQAMRDSSEEAARVAPAKEVTKQLSSPRLQSRSNTCDGSVSRQASRDTLPNEPSSSFFEEALAGTHSLSQRTTRP